MKTILTAILVIFLTGFLWGQNFITLSFEAEEFTNGNSLILDSVLVQNLDKECDTTLYAGDDLIIDILSGLEAQMIIEQSTLVYPNPFLGKTNLIIHSKGTGDVKLTIRNLNGLPLFSKDISLFPGKQFYSVYTSEKTSILTLKGKESYSAFTLVNTSPSYNNGVSYQQSNHSPLKSSFTDDEFIYQNGDILQLIGFTQGYIPDTLDDSPTSNTLYTFEMEDLPPPELPEIETLNISEISYTSVTGGGNVIHNGWIPLTARGLCWNLNPEPTIENNFTQEGTDVGLFTSTMYELDTNTTYFVRAYATNAVGTSYGEEYSFTSKSDIPCPGIPSFTYGGQIYETVLIGSQCWIKQHMNIGTIILDSEEPEDNGTIEKWCYDDDPENCNEYGGLYNWDEVMQYEDLPGSQGLCPEGWHVPTHENFKTLEGTTDSQYPIGDPIWDTFIRGYDVCTNLKSSSGWSLNGNGTDVYGFYGLPAGYRWPNGGFTEIELVFQLWTSSEASNDNYAYVRDFRYYENRILYWETQKIQGYSVRCLHNESF